MNQSLPERTVVLLGIGHTNAHIVRMWSMDPIPKTRLVCLSNFPVSTYSGMLPGVLAGDYRPEQMQIDLVRLCASSGAELILDDVTGLDLPGRKLLFESRPELTFDALSIGVGSVPQVDADVSPDAPVLAIKPMQTFLDRLAAHTRPLLSTSASDGGRPITVAVVGGGAAGVEISLCLPSFLRRTNEQENPNGVQDHKITLIHRDTQLLSGSGSGLRSRVERELSARGVDVLCGRTVTRVDGRQVRLDDGTERVADVVLWATGAAAPPLLHRLGLPTDDGGFLLTDATLKSTADAPVFAVGDSGTLQSDPTPKAGVYAVRQGPILWDNLRRILDGRILKPFEPQRQFLKLLNRGNGTAFGEYHGISFGGSWVWRLKDRIDRRFMEMYQPAPMAEMSGTQQPPMRCHGCGSKLSSTSLFGVLESVNRRQREIPGPDDPETVPVGVSEADDAAVVRLDDSHQIVLTTDFFPAPLDDAYLSGRLAALHAMNDVFAMGARPTAAMAIATVTEGPPRAQRDRLHELMHGCTQEFARTGTSLVGGHTTEGPETMIGFSVVGTPWGDELCRKGPLDAGENDAAVGLAHRLEPDDRLILTKPLGTGVLLAAHRRAECDADWFVSLIEAMLSDVGADARLAWDLGARLMTDVSGFGLAGHLLELLRGHSLGAEVDLAAVPTLPGSVECSKAGVASSLYASNRDAVIERMQISAELTDHPQLPLLFDPQTCGGLLFVLPPAKTDGFLKESAGVATVIGRLVRANPATRLRVV